MKVQHEAHGLFVKGRLVAAKAAVHDRECQHVHQLLPVMRSLLWTVYAAHAHYNLSPAPADRTIEKFPDKS